MIDAPALRELLSSYQALGGGLGWTHGAVGAGIETSQADGVHGGTLFAPTDDYHAEAAQPAIDVAAARLACAAVNALPDLLTIYEAVCAVEHQAPCMPQALRQFAMSLGSPGDSELVHLINLVRAYRRVA
jgi:hypothetical protein